MLQQLRIQIMEPFPFNVAIKNRSHRSENIWTPPPNQTQPSFTIHNSSSSKNNQTAYVYAYLIIEKNIKTLAQSLKKLFAKHKRFAFRKIMETNVRSRGEKSLPLNSTVPQAMRNKKESEKTVTQSMNPEILTGQLATLCRKVLEQNIEKLFWTVNQQRTRSIMYGFTHIQCWNKAYTREASSENSNGYQFQSNLKGTTNGSRISNKRKTTRNGKGDEVKQNSHCNGSQFSHQNQRLRNELLGQDFERQQFAEKMHELLDYHEKYLLQGSTTTRGKKQR